MRSMTLGLVLSLLAAAGSGAQQRPGFFGVGFTHNRDAREQWLTVRIIVPGGPAQAAGIRVGDVITAIDGNPIRFANMAEVMALLSRIKPQQRVEVTIVRGGKSTKRTLTAIRMPDEYWERWQATLKVARERAANASQ